MLPSYFVIAPTGRRSRIARYSFSVAAVTFGAYLTLLMRSARRRAESAAERLHESEKRVRFTINGVLGIVAHDLRNPLTSIMQSVALAQRTPDPERLHRRLDLISRAAHRMDRLIQDLLDVSLIEAGQLKIDREQIPTDVLVREAVESERPLASSSGLDIRIDVPVHTEDVWASRDRLHQVFTNLIGNAIKFTGTGGHITVGAASRQQEVLFSVADTGRGIPSEKLAHVFDRFWTAVPTAGRLGPALGLVIIKGIVEAHGGRVWVESAAGHGTTFFFTIPKASSNSRRTAVTST